MEDRSSILSKLAASESHAAGEASHWFAPKDTELLPTLTTVSVYEARHLWRVRLANSQANGHTLNGAEQLLAELAGMTQQIKLDQFGFINSKETGSVFFEHTTGRFIGGVMVKRKKEPESRSMHSSSKPITHAAAHH